MDLDFAKALKVVETALLEAALAKQDNKITIGEIRSLSYKVVQEVLKALGWWKLAAFTIKDKDILIGMIVECANCTAEIWLSMLGLEDDAVVVIDDES